MPHCLPLQALHPHINEIKGKEEILYIAWLTDMDSPSGSQEGE